MKQPFIIIVGAGFAGLSSYLVLRKRLGKSPRILLIDQRKQFTYIPALHNCIGNTGYLNNIQFDYQTYYKDDFLHAEVSNISKTSVTITSGEIFHPDYIIIATGSRTNTFGNTSFDTYGQHFRFAEDIEKLNKKLTTCTSISVIGGGYTGIEIICTLAQKYPEKKLRIIHSRERLLDRYSVHVSHTVEQRLSKRGVEIILQKKVKNLTNNQVICDDGSSFASDCHILSSGIAINDDSYRENLVFQNSYQSLEGDHIYLCGDVAHHGLLPTAHNAMIEGRRIGHMLANHYQGKETPLPPLENWVILALAMGTRDGMITNGTKGFFVPYLIGFCKRVIERRCMFEFMHKIMLRV